MVFGKVFVVVVGRRGFTCSSTAFVYVFRVLFMSLEFVSVKFALLLGV